MKKQRSAAPHLEKFSYTSNCYKDSLGFQILSFGKDHLADLEPPQDFKVTNHFSFLVWCCSKIEIVLYLYFNDIIYLSETYKV